MRKECQEKIDIVANDRNDYIFGECKWRNEKLDSSVFRELKERRIFSARTEAARNFIFSNPKYDSVRTITIDSELHSLLSDEKARQEKNRVYYNEYYHH